MEKREKRRIVIRMVLITLISIVLGFGIYNWNAQSLSGNMMPMPFGVGLGVVTSGSMEPELSVNDLIIVRARSEYEVDDVIVFQQNGKLVVHKIIEISEEEVITQGTANDSPDAPMPLTSIKGEVVGRVKKIGGAVQFLKSPVGTILMLALAFVLLLQSYQGEKETQESELDEIRKEIERLKEEKERKQQEKEKK